LKTKQAADSSNARRALRMADYFIKSPADAEQKHFTVAFYANCNKNLIKTYPTLQLSYALSEFITLRDSVLRRCFLLPDFFRLIFTQQCRY